MAKVKLTLSANAGGALQLGSHRILIDALHRGKLPGFSTLSKDLQEQVFSHSDFAEPEMICVTHDHLDHYSHDLAVKAKTLWPNAKCCLPEDGLQIVSDDLQLTYLPLIHEGEQFAEVAHHGILITWHGKHILIPGDCRIADEALLRQVTGMQIHLVILNFPWLTLKKGRDCLKNVLQPGAAVFWHLPFAVDDVNGYRKSAEAALAQYQGMLLCDPLQSIEIEI